ncbi:MAG: DMT family transporter [Dysgonamonadaceae bacterium]|jgi:drug/metabolite transporter (DMT)-like permease|nr:DMT family transporter [Dysgonamonadaceae bacterium]
MKAKTLKEARNGYLFGIISGITWGLDTLLISVIMAKAPFTTSVALIAAGTFVCSFFHDGFAAFWVTLYQTFRKKIQYIFRKMKTRDGFFCMLGAVLGGPIAMTGYILAIKYAGPSYTATISTCYPALGVALAVVFLKEKLPLKGWLGVFICIVGIIWLSYAPADNSAESLYLGIVFSVVSAFGWALESVVCAYGMKKGDVDPEMALTIREITSFFIYGAIIVPVFCGSYNGVADVLISNSVFWLLLTALTGVTSFLTWYKSIDMIGASRAIALNVTYSFWTIIFTFLFLGGEFSFKTLICSVLIICGVALAVGKPEEILTNK